MKHLVFAMGLLALVSCKDSKNQENINNKNVVEQSRETTNQHHQDEVSNVYDNSWTEEIEMNNGTKWKADAVTNEGVQKMQNSINTRALNTLDDYHQLAEKLNDDKNYVVKNCTMKGASHDNLHVWLLPLMVKIEALSETKSAEDASKITHSIEENINAYDNYFQ